MPGKKVGIARKGNELEGQGGLFMDPDSSMSSGLQANI